MNIESVIQQHSQAIEWLLYRRRVIGPVNMATIQKAHDRYGESFMMDLLKIITPTGNTSNFTNFADMLKPGGFVDTAVKSQQQAAPGNKGKFWGFIDKLLTSVEKTGQTIGQFKTDTNGQPIPGTYQQPQPINPKVIYIVAAVLIVLIVTVLLLKKK